MSAIVGSGVSTHTRTATSVARGGSGGREDLRQTLSATLRNVLGVLPASGLLPDEIWRRRHQVIVSMAVAHIPVLPLFSALTGHDLGHAIAGGLAIGAFAVVASREDLDQRLRSAMASFALLTSSAVLVHLSSGLIEMHFHFFVVVPLLALYQSWTPFLLAIAYVVLHHFAVGLLEPGSVFNHAGGMENPLVWAVIHGGFIAALSVVSVVAWSLSQRAFRDPLTSLASRSLFIDRLQDGITNPRGRGDAAVLFIDVDDFKTVNDSLGHEAGDRLLAAVGQRIRHSIRSQDTAARLGGDEFAVLLHDTTGSDAIRAAERILATLRDPYVIDGQPVSAGASIGIAWTGVHKQSAIELLRDADLAMYAAKAKGKGQYATFALPMYEAAQRRLAVSAGLRTALERRQLSLAYQPIVEIEGSAVAGVEALVRWQHHVLGDVVPAELIANAEATGAIVEVGEYVLREACRQAAEWRKLMPGLTLSVNLSVRQIEHPGLIDMIAAALRETRFPPERLVLEITESVMASEIASAVSILEMLKNLGLRLAIDDFGTGYSSLANLRRLPFDIVKLDRSYVHELSHVDPRTSLAAAVIAVGRMFRMSTVAEGVEEPQQLEALKRLGCTHAQGFLLARPLPAAELTRLLKASPRPDSRRQITDTRSTTAPSHTTDVTQLGDQGLVGS